MVGPLKTLEGGVFVNAENTDLTSCGFGCKVAETPLTVWCEGHENGSNRRQTPCQLRGHHHPRSLSALGV